MGSILFRMQSAMAGLCLATNADIKLNGQVKIAALQHDPELSNNSHPYLALPPTSGNH